MIRVDVQAPDAMTSLPVAKAAVEKILKEKDIVLYVIPPMDPEFGWQAVPTDEQSLNQLAETIRRS